LDWRELLLYFYEESKKYIKDITEIEETTGGMKGVKTSNDSVSPSLLICTKEVME
jgi:hypothetical protein